MEILIVDDDEVDRALVIRTLKKSDLEVNITQASTVDEGLALFKSSQFDIVLLDYRMPQRDGIEMIVELRNEPKEESTAIVMMSSSEDESLALECIHAGAQDFLLKSDISEVRLRRALLHATTRFELERQLFTTYQKVKLLAETDSLTELPNRYFFDESLKIAIGNKGRKGARIALLLFDLDNFKMVNDSFGHDTGDVLLKKIVTRIKGCLRGNELFARLGGDEFAITLTNLGSDNSASLVARRIITVLQKPIEIAKTVIHTSASIGIAIYPDNGGSSEELFKYADIAMYRAKKLGRNQVCFFEPEMQRIFSRRLQVELELRSAIEKNQLELYYQPVVNPKTGVVKGFEALIRWNIENEIRPPIDFISIAEESRQINIIGAWVIEQAIATVAKWNLKSDQYFTMAINVSSVQLDEVSLVPHIANCLEKYLVPAKQIEIEITETAFLKNTIATENVMMLLKDLGCRLSLDDFGTGFSSISHLQNYPISIVKIDSSLMPENAEDRKNVALVKGLVSMAHILGLDIIAEGIETSYHCELCVALGISRVQGYLFAKPMPIQDAYLRYMPGGLC